MQRYFLFWISAFLGSFSLFGQAIQPVSWPVELANGRTLRWPFSGGASSPQFSMIDWDGDGDDDLFLFDRVGNAWTLFTYEQGLYRLEHAMRGQFPKEMQHWALIRDYNQDGVPDLFTFGQNFRWGVGIQCWRGVYTGGTGQIRFVQQNEVLTYTSAQASEGLFVSGADLPALDDIDLDGDLDVLTFTRNGGYVEWYKNMSQERGFGSDSLLFEKADDCWGRFYESGIGSALTLSNRQDSCVGRANWTALRSPRHAGSTLLTLDMDADGVRDLILGDLSFDNLVLAENSGSVDSAYVQSQQVQFPPSKPVDLRTFPAAYYLDANQDGIKDLVVAPNAVAGANDRATWLYYNFGADNRPDFNFERGDWIVGDMLDVGTGAYPCWADMNGDGLTDLLVGNYGYYTRSTGGYVGQIAYYQNIGSHTQAAFKLIDDDFAQLAQHNLQRVVPTVGDIDDDGDLDLILGQERGPLLYLENTGSAQQARFAPIQTNYQGINPGIQSHPQLWDLDKDGLLDLIVGEQNGNINFYKNVGTPTSPQFTLSSSTLGQVNAQLPGTAAGNSAPHFFMYQGRTQLLVGNYLGRIMWYDSIEHNLTGTFRLRTSHLGDLDEGREAAISVHTWGGNAVPHFVVGNLRGGLSAWSFDALVALQEAPQQATEVRAEVFPNPTRGAWHIRSNRPIQRVELWNSLGQRVFHENCAGTSAQFSHQAQSQYTGWHIIHIYTDGGLQSIPLHIR